MSVQRCNPLDYEAEHTIFSSLLNLTIFRVEFAVHSLTRLFLFCFFSLYSVTSRKHKYVYGIILFNVSFTSVPYPSIRRRPRSSPQDELGSG